MNDKYWGLCDVGGCGNGATGPEIAVYVAETGDYLEVSLCDDHPDLRALDRDVLDPLRESAGSLWKRLRALSRPVL